MFHSIIISFYVLPMLFPSVLLHLLDATPLKFQILQVLQILGLKTHGVIRG